MLILGYILIMVIVLIPISLGLIFGFRNFNDKDLINRTFAKSAIFSAILGIVGIILYLLDAFHE